jgi:DNA-binding MarR family transcriptional regulator
VDLTLSRKLHKLTARLDRAAGVRLRTGAGVSYPRFLALYMVGSEGADTQRALAERLGVSEPSVSRMVRVLAENEWLEVVPDPAGGNRNRLKLTRAGQQLVESWGGELETRLANLLEAVGVPYDTYLSHTERLLDALDTEPAGARVRARSQPGSVPGRA